MNPRRGLPASPRRRLRTAREISRLFQTALFLLALICAFGVLPASAGIRADVDRDGRIDSVRVGESPATITIVFGGTARRQVLRSTGTLTCVVLSDIDADGDLDIVGTSGQSGIVLWRNSGRGRFIPSKVAQLRWLMRAGPRLDHGGGSAVAPDPAVTDPERLAITEAAADPHSESFIRASRPRSVRPPAALAVTTESRAPPARSPR